MVRREKGYSIANNDTDERICIYIAFILRSYRGNDTVTRRGAMKRRAYKNN